jgi:hypothetical protein
LRTRKNTPARRLANMALAGRKPSQSPGRYHQYYRYYRYHHRQVLAMRFRVC